MRRLILFIAVPMILLSSVALFFTLWVIEESHEIPIDLQVDAILGFNLDTDGIHLGRVLTPGRANRAVEVLNPGERARYARIYISGNISRFVEADVVHFRLGKNESRKVIFSAVIPPATPYGNYSGTVKIVFSRIPVG